MDDPEFLDLVMRYQEGTLTRDEHTRFEQQLLSDSKKRQLFSATLLQAAALHDQFRHEALRLPEVNAKANLRYRILKQPLSAVAMLMLGLLVGLLGSSVVRAMTTVQLVVTTEELSGLIDGDFELPEMTMLAGFPHDDRVWSGDRVEVVSSDDATRQHCLSFVKAESDANSPAARAIACDLFQLVDLHDIPRQLRDHDSSLLELSAEFLDARPENIKPSVTFFCQIYLFRGDLSTMHETWPNRISEAVSSGSAEITTLGASGWQAVTARCLVTDDADFAVIHIAARPNIRGPMPPNVFADHVKLTLKTRPTLPERRVER